MTMRLAIIAAAALVLLMAHANADQEKCADSQAQNNIKASIEKIPNQQIIDDNDDNANFCSLHATLIGYDIGDASCTCEFYQTCVDQPAVEVVLLTKTLGSVTYGICQTLWYHWLILALVVLCMLGCVSCLIRCLCRRCRQPPPPPTVVHVVHEP